MRNFRRLFKLKQTAWSLIGGLMLAGLLGGCQTPFIDIKVQVDNMAGACPSGGTRVLNSEDPPGIGGCNNGGTGPIVVSNTICKNASGGTMQCQSSFICSAGNKCAVPPGTENRKSCKTIWTQTSGNNGSCSCTGYY